MNRPVCFPGFLDGLRYLGDGFRLDPEFVHFGSVDELLKLQETFAEREGTEFTIIRDDWIAAQMGEAAESFVGTTDPTEKTHYKKICLDLIELGIEMYPDSSEILAAQGTYHRHFGKKENAIEFCKKALELDPDNDDVEEALDELTKAEEVALTLSSEEQAVLVGTYRGEGFPLTEIKLEEDGLKMYIGDFTIAIPLVPQSKMAFSIPENYFGGSVKAKIDKGKVVQITVITTGNGKYTLKPVK